MSFHPRILIFFIYIFTFIFHTLGEPSERGVTESTEDDDEESRTHDGHVSDFLPSLDGPLGKRVVQQERVVVTHVRCKEYKYPSWRMTTHLA